MRYARAASSSRPIRASRSARATWIRGGFGDRARVVLQQLAVQDRDLPPVGGGGAGRGRVTRGDRRPELVRARLPHPQRLDQEALAVGDHGLVPAGPVLLLEQDQGPAAVCAGRPAGVGQQQQGEQPPHLGIPGQPGRQAAGQVEAGHAQVGPEQVVARRRLVALAEDEVHDPQHVGRPGLQQFGPGQGQGQASVADLVLRPGQALGHGGFRDQERGRDLRRGQPADRPQRQGDPRLRAERRVTAQVDEPQVLIGRTGRAGRPAGGPGRLLAGRFAGGRLLGRAPRLPPQPVQRLVPGHTGQPRLRITRHVAGGPLLHRDHARVLHAVLGHVEPPGGAGHLGHGAPPAAAQQLLEFGPQRPPPVSTIARTSTEQSRAAGMATAHLSASVQVRAVDDRVPADLLPAPPPPTRTVVAAEVAVSGAQSTSTPASAMARTAARGSGQPVVQGRSLSGLRTAQMCVILSPTTSNANTVTVTPSCWATRPGWPLTVRSRIVRPPGTRPAISAR